MNAPPLSVAIISALACAAQAQPAPPGPPQGWGGFVLNNITLQQGAEAALRSRPSPYRTDLVTDTGSRLLNVLGLRLRQGDWTVHATYSDSRTLGGHAAYSLTNPLSFGVHTVETQGSTRRAVDAKSGIQELAASHQKNGRLVMVGKIDTANWYLANPIFGGDLTLGNDFGNAATRVVAPPFPSLALLLRQDLGEGWSLTGIVGDAFGDRETLDAGRNLARGDLAYVLELNAHSPSWQHQLTFSHTDAFRFLDKDAVWPVSGGKAPQVNALMATTSHRFNAEWAAFARVAYARGAGQLEDVNYLAGVRFDAGSFYLLASQSATRVATDNTPYQRGARGDHTFVTELTLNHKPNRWVTLGLTYNLYRSSGASLLAKDGGRQGARSNQVVDVRMTSFLPF
ncbi:MAG: hypothetical protein Q8S02_02845 [Hydrogenophaga sp.]|nr:hypothetical protein [Hydrogenophaga sp.]